MERGAGGRVFSHVRRGFGLVLAVCGIANAQSAVDIVQRSLERDTTNFERLKDYTYQQRQEQRELDASGHVTKSEAETHDVMMLAGRPYERLIARNDQPLSESEARREQAKIDRELDKREHMSAADRAKLEKNRAENRKFMNEVPQAFRFHLDGVEQVSGKAAWVIECDPNPAFQPRDSRAKVLTKLRGKVWIDQGEYQWVKAEMEATDAVSFGLGLFRIAPGGLLSFEQKRVNGEVWVPTHALIRADARIAYVKKVRAEIEITYQDYKKFQTDSRIVAEQK